MKQEQVNGSMDRRVWTREVDERWKRNVFTGRLHMVIAYRVRISARTFFVHFVQSLLIARILSTHVLCLFV